MQSPRAPRGALHELLSGRIFACVSDLEKAGQGIIVCQVRNAFLELGDRLQRYLHPSWFPLESRRGAGRQPGNIDFIGADQRGNAASLVSAIDLAQASARHDYWRERIDTSLVPARPLPLFATTDELSAHVRVTVSDPCPSRGVKRTRKELSPPPSAPSLLIEASDSRTPSSPCRLCGQEAHADAELAFVSCETHRLPLCQWSLLPLVTEPFVVCQFCGRAAMFGDASDGIIQLSGRECQPPHRVAACAWCASPTRFTCGFFSARRLVGKAGQAAAAISSDGAPPTVPNESILTPMTSDEQKRLFATVKEGGDLAYEKLKRETQRARENAFAAVAAYELALAQSKRSKHRDGDDLGTS